jgi:hypothetical protein
MFSDEGHFELQFGTSVDRCRRPKGSDRFSTKFTRKTVMHPPKGMAWDCFSWNGQGGLEFLKKGMMMNRIRFKQLLDEKLEFFYAPASDNTLSAGWSPLSQGQDCDQLVQ